MKSPTILALFIFFVSCSTDTKRYTPRAIESAYIGSWTESKPLEIPFRAELNIHPDGSFDYSGRSCFFQFEGIGHWRATTNGIILNSVSVADSIVAYPYGENCETINDLGNDALDETQIESDSNSQHNIISFHNVLLSLRSDTLIHVNTEANSCPELNGFFTK